MVQPSRRSVLAGGGAVCAYALLVGCGSDPPESTPTTTGTGGAAGAIAAVADVPVGGGVVKGDLVLVQPTAGVVKAYSTRCPHQATPLPAPAADGVITCPGHGARFRAADGSLIDGPAPRGLQVVAVRVADGNVFRV